MGTFLRKPQRNHECENKGVATEITVPPRILSDDYPKGFALACAAFKLNLISALYLSPLCLRALLCWGRYRASLSGKRVELDRMTLC